ncbi:hypothetical protein GCM10007887_11250 [Methylobacterium haplocladii]|uniref:Uncharacterized protein n=1 Tax=Methylobacterium haplocladii TaxID=1176176 RepID=A0A512IRP3_9HYPH|nr:hypothetical protein MHA02_27380 [Methylobacterium haplocladii]GLS58463.1 hypothetical protein GCM10007887_11250 [Methylobacterium haplocladii]
MAVRFGSPGGLTVRSPRIGKLADMFAFVAIAGLTTLGLLLAGGAKGMAMHDANRQCGGYW